MTGAMLRDIQVTQVEAQRVSIGFGDQKQELKMKGNIRWSPASWGWSPMDEKAIFEAFVQLLQARIARIKLK